MTKEHSNQPAAKPSKQIGASDRGPEDLDRAKKNRGLPPDAVTVDEEDEQALSSGRTVEEERKSARERADQASQKKTPRSEPRVRSAAEAEEEAAAEAARAAQPGGARPSESERPQGPRSRWGDGQGKPH